MSNAVRPWHAAGHFLDATASAHWPDVHAWITEEDRTLYPLGSHMARLVLERVRADMVHFCGCAEIMAEVGAMLIAYDEPPTADEMMFHATRQVMLLEVPIRVEVPGVGVGAVTMNLPLRRTLDGWRVCFTRLAEGMPDRRGV